MPMNVKESLLLDSLPLRKTIPTSLTNSLPWIIGEGVSRITLFGTESLAISILKTTKYTHCEQYRPECPAKESSQQKRLLPNKPPRCPTKTRRRVYNNQCVGSLVNVVITNSTH